jgi:chemotaxis signal transduction protein
VIAGRFSERLGASGATKASFQDDDLCRVAFGMSVPSGIESPPTAPGESLLLIVRLGEQRFVVPVVSIARILPMAAPLPLVAPPAGVIGGLVIAGVLLPIVDPRPAFGVPTVAPGVAQHLLLLDTEPSFLLWVDRAETIERVRLPATDSVAQSALVRLGEVYLPLLDPSAFAPGASTGWGREGWR